MRFSSVGVFAVGAILMPSVPSSAQDFGAWQLQEQRDKFDKGRYSCVAVPGDGSVWFASERHHANVNIFIQSPSDIRASIVRAKLQDYRRCEVQKSMDRTVYCREYDYPLVDLKIEYLVNDGEVQSTNQMANPDRGVDAFAFEVSNKLTTQTKVDYRVLMDLAPYTGKFTEEVYRGSVSLPSPADAYAASKECVKRQAENPQK